LDADFDTGAFEGAFDRLLACADFFGPRAMLMLAGDQTVPHRSNTPPHTTTDCSRKLPMIPFSGCQCEYASLFQAYHACNGESCRTAFSPQPTKRRPPRPTAQIRSGAERKCASGREAGHDDDENRYNFVAAKPNLTTVPLHKHSAPKAALYSLYTIINARNDAALWTMSSRRG
jgi:hypothetical protein